MDDLDFREIQIEEADRLFEPHHSEKGTTQMQFNQIVSGLHHSTYYPGLIDKIEAGMQVTLEPNPENQFDKQAIKVLFEGKHIGWIPMKHAGKPNLAKKEIFEAMEAGVVFKAEVLLHDLHRPLYDRLTISVASVEDEAEEN